MLASMGVETGIDLAKLFALRRRVGEWLQGEALHGSVFRAGLPRTMNAGATA